MDNITNSGITQLFNLDPGDKDQTHDKYDSVTVKLSCDISRNIIDILKEARLLKIRVLSNLTEQQLTDRVNKVNEDMINSLAKYRLLNIDSLPVAEDEGINSIVRNTNTDIKDEDIPKLEYPKIYLDKSDPKKPKIKLALDKKQVEVITSIDEKGVTSVNGLPETREKLIKGSSAIELDASSFNAMVNNEPGTVSVAVDSRFEPLITHLPISSETKEGIVKFASDVEIDEAIENNTGTTSAVSPKNIHKLLEGKDFVPEAPTDGKTYALQKKGNTYPWAEFNFPKPLQEATVDDAGIVALASYDELKKGTDEKKAVTSASLEQYIKEKFVDNFKYPDSDGKYYAAVDSSKRKDGRKWIEIYNNPNDLPIATEDAYGVGIPAEVDDIEKNKNKGRIVSDTIAEDFLNKAHPKLYKPTGLDTSKEYILNKDSTGLNLKEFTSTLIPASTTVHGITKKEIDYSQAAEKSTTSAVTPKYIHEAFLQAGSGTNNAKIPDDANPKDIFLLKNGKYKKINYDDIAATTTAYGTVKIYDEAANVANAKEQLKTNDSIVVPTKNLALLEDKNNSVFKDMPNDEKTYIFKSNGQAIEYVETDTSKLSSFKTVFLDEDDNEREEFYQTATHIVSSMSELQHIEHKKLNYGINIGQLLT